jgi:hypothetical protein
MENFNCPRCRAQIDAEDRYCRCCGIRIKATHDLEFAEIQLVPEPRPVKFSPADNPWLVLLLLFFVLGPLALPMLWQSRAFTPLWKLIWTLLTVAYIFFTLWLLYFVTNKMILEPLRQLRF